jgi:hypothetical protein
MISVPGIFQVKLDWARVNYVMSGWLILLFQTELHVAFYFHSILVTTNGDQWKGTYMLSLQASPGDKDPTPTLSRPQLYS